MSLSHLRVWQMEMSMEELGFSSLQVRAGAVVQDAHGALQRRPRRRAEPGVAAGMVQARRQPSPSKRDLLAPDAEIGQLLENVSLHLNKIK